MDISTNKNEHDRSQVDVSCISQPHTNIKSMDVNSLIEISTRRKRCWLTVLSIVLHNLVIIAVFIPLFIILLNNRNISTSTITTITTTTTSITIIATISRSTTTTITTTTNTITTNFLSKFCNATCLIVNQAELSTYTAAWTFENSISDIVNEYHGYSVNGINYSPGYIGQALSLSGLSYVVTPFINFSQSSFTIEAWIKANRLAVNGPNYAIFGQCQATGITRANCMRLLLFRNSSTYKLYMDFHIDSLVGSTDISSSLVLTWLHVAFVFDYSLKQQIIYLNGYNDGQATLPESSPGAYMGTSGMVNIGAQQTNNLFYGLIDQMFVTNRAKTACEILDDATLVAYYTFNSGSMEDSGPNNIIGIATSDVKIIDGYHDQALSFGSPNAYFIVNNLVLLGKTNQAFSFSMWIKPTCTISGGTILHIANGDDFSGSGWCMPFIGFDYSNRLTLQIYSHRFISLLGPELPLNVWTHIVETYSATKGISLYVNGTLVQTTGSSDYSASGTSNYIIVGYHGPLGTKCLTNSILPGVFYGAIDELRIYSRELTMSDVCVLAGQ